MSDIRICDLTPYDTLRVRCTCGRSVDYLPGMPKKKGFPGEKKIADMRFVCVRCGAKTGFRITVMDERTRGDSSKRSERVIIAGDDVKRTGVKLQHNAIVGNKNFVWREDET